MLLAPSPGVVVSLARSAIYLRRGAAPRSLLAGDPAEAGYVDGPAAAARFDGLAAACVTDNNQLVVADELNHCLRAVSLATGAVTTVAGAPHRHGVLDGAIDAAEFQFPSSVLCHQGALWVAEACSGRVCRIAHDRVTTVYVAGYDDVGVLQFALAPLAAAFPAFAAVTDAGTLCVLRPFRGVVSLLESVPGPLSPAAVASVSVSDAEHYVVVAHTPLDLPGELFCVHLESDTALRIPTPAIPITDATAVAVTPDRRLLVRLAPQHVVAINAVPGLFDRPPTLRRSFSCAAWLDPGARARIRAVLAVAAAAGRRPHLEPLGLPPELWWLIILHLGDWPRSVP